MARILNEDEAIARIKDNLASFERQVGKKITGYYMYYVSGYIRPCAGGMLYYWCCPKCGWVSLCRESDHERCRMVRCLPGNPMEVY